jgi:aspartate/methionine/tyrosine aminotransferase
MQTISDILDEVPHILTVHDSVYDFLAYEGHTHIPFASIGKNWNRTLTVYSGGKLLNATGWKVGWAIAPREILVPIEVVHFPLFMGFNVPVQVAIAKCMAKLFEKGSATDQTGQPTELSYVENTRHVFMSSRDYLYKELKEIDVPWEPIISEGGYFLVLDIHKMRPLIPAKYFETHDYEDPALGPAVSKYRLSMPDGSIPTDFAFCRWLAVEHGVVVLPMSFFFPLGSKKVSDSFVRMGICKTRQNIEKTVERLKKLGK